jgi:putative spermidine/putrescine transport system substrate-binding protein
VIRFLFRINFILVIAIFFTACNNKSTKQEDLTKLDWAQIVAKAKGTTIVMNMHQGDKKANTYMSDYVVPALKEQYGITLKVIGGQGKEIINNIMAEKESNTTVGQTDLCWINGETFYQLRQIDGLYGPFVQQLPNAKYIDFTDPLIKYDFQEEVKGYETPWGKAFFLGVTDTARVKEVPVTMQDFEAYWQAHPGKFTIPQDFMGLTLLKTWLIELAGGIQELNGPFNEEKYKKYSTQLWEFINRNKKNFWKNGETFPASAAPIAQMFSSGELDFTFAFGNSEIDKKVAEGLYPATSKAFILKAGCTNNTNYLGITYNSGNKAAAMVACNFMISPEAQVKKNNFKIWGGSTVLDYDKLDKKWQDEYDSLPRLNYGLSDAEIKARSIPETVPEYMIKIGDDFRKFVIDAK